MREQQVSKIVALAEQRQKELHDGDAWNAHTLLHSAEDPNISPRPRHPEKGHSPKKEASVLLLLLFCFVCLLCYHIEVYFRC